MQKFEPDQLVLIRESEKANWDLARYSYCSVEQGQGQDHIHHIQGLRWFRDDEIIPYSGNEHLLGTTGQPTPKWEPKPGELVAVRDSIQDAWVARIFYGKATPGDFQFRCETEDQDERIDWKFCEPIRKHFFIPEE